MHNMKGMSTAFLVLLLFSVASENSDVTSITRQPKTNLEIAAEPISF